MKTYVNHNVSSLSLSSTCLSLRSLEKITFFFLVKGICRFSCSQFQSQKRQEKQNTMNTGAIAISRIFASQGYQSIMIFKLYYGIFYLVQELKRYFILYFIISEVPYSIFYSILEHQKKFHKLCYAILCRIEIFVIRRNS